MIVITPSIFPKSALWYFPAIAIAELLTILAGGLPGGMAHAALILVLLNHYRHLPDKRNALILLGLPLVSLVRLLSLTLSFPELSPLHWYGLIGIPMLMAIAGVIRMYGTRPLRLTAGTAPLAHQLLFGGVGLLLSPLAYIVLRPAAPPEFSPLELALAAIGIAVTAGWIEEVIFRGLLQPAAIRLYGPAGLWLSNTLFAVMYIGFLSVATLLFFYAVGFLFAWWSRRTQSVWGVALAHGLMMVVALLVFPAIL